MEPQQSLQQSDIPGKPAINQAVAPVPNGTGLSKDGVRYVAHSGVIRKQPLGRLDYANGVIEFSDQQGVSLCKFNVADIISLKQELEIMRLKTATARYVFCFPGWDRSFAAAPLGGFGLGVEYQAQKSSGVQLWISEIQRANPNIDMHNNSFGRLMKRGVILCLFIFAVMIIYVLAKKA